MKNNNVAAATGEIKSLTFFRFFTAFLVFIFHVRIHLNAIVPLFDKFILQGAIFMSAFFMLSGFIMYYVYSKMDFTIFKNVKNFYLKRFAKIYPSYLCVVIISYFMVSGMPFLKILITVPMSIFCLQSLFYVSFPYLMNGGLWSLSVEAVFYMLFPFIHFVFISCKRHYKRIILISYFLTLYPSFVQYFFGKTEDLYVNPFFRLPEFILGICLGHCYISKYFIKMKESLLCIGSFIGLIILISFISSLKISANANFSGKYNYFNFISIPLIGVFIYSLAIMKNKIILKITNNTICNYLGKISYSFYLTQFIAITMVGKRYFINSGCLSYLVPFVINILTSIIMYELIERPFRKKILIKYGVNK